MTELLLDEKNSVFTFDGSLGQQIWEPSPVTRFRFKKPVDNETIAGWLKSNRPMCGIVFNGVPYVGTSDGFIDTPDKRITRIPEILVDEELFLDDYAKLSPAKAEAVGALRRFDKSHDALNTMGSDLVRRAMELYEKRNEVHSQHQMIDRYLDYIDYRLTRSSIVGFVVHKNKGRYYEQRLFDGSMLGIHDTDYGDRVNILCPQTLCQIDAETAGVVPAWGLYEGGISFDVKDGIETRTPMPCVDHRSLWSLNGKARYIADICPRDGSGYAPAKFATDGKVSAIAHGNHPWYVLDIKTSEEDGKITERRIEDCQPWILRIRDGQVYGCNADNVTNYTTGKKVLGGYHVTSLSDSSNLCTIDDGDKTLIFDFTTGKDNNHIYLPGKFKFLPTTVK
jgi:hypothetical protein